MLPSKELVGVRMIKKIEKWIWMTLWFCGTKYINTLHSFPSSSLSTSLCYVSKNMLEQMECPSLRVSKKPNEVIHVPSVPSCQKSLLLRVRSAVHDVKESDMAAEQTYCLA